MSFTKPESANPAKNQETAFVAPGRLQQSGFAFRIPLKETILTLLCVALVALVANYLLASGFGIYEDDYTYVHFLPPATWSVKEVVHRILSFWHHWTENEGRPFYCTISILLAKSSAPGASLFPGFLLGYLIHTLNGFLLYRVLRNLLTFEAALAGAFAYLTFFPDVSKILLMHRGIYVGMTVLLCSILLYQRGRPFAAYALSSTLLFLYESYYPPFVAAPLLLPGTRRVPLRRLIAHAVILAAFAGACLFLRSNLGDQRATLITGGLREILPKMVLACIIGPATCFQRSFLSGPVEGLEHTNWVFAAVSVATVGLVFFVCHARGHRFDTPRYANRQSLNWRLFIGALVALIAGYCLMFRENYYPPTTVLGRISALHCAAGLGWGLLIGFAVAFLEARLRQSRKLLCAITALYLALAINFGLSIQKREWVDSWSLQRTFWNQLIAYSGNFGPDDVVLIDASGFPHIPALDFENFLYNEAPDTLHYFLHFPKTWKGYPRIFGIRLYPGNVLKGDAWYCPYNFEEDGLRLHIPVWGKPARWPLVRAGHFFLFTSRDDTLLPISKPVELFGKRFTPKSIDPELPVPFNSTHVYRAIMQ
jgi:hypothetical protein